MGDLNPFFLNLPNIVPCHIIAAAAINRVCGYKYSKGNTCCLQHGPAIGEN